MHYRGDTSWRIIAFTWESAVSSTHLCLSSFKLIYLYSQLAHWHGPGRGWHARNSGFTWRWSSEWRSSTRVPGDQRACNGRGIYLTSSTGECKQLKQQPASIRWSKVLRGNVEKVREARPFGDVVAGIRSASEWLHNMKCNFDSWFFVQNGINGEWCCKDKVYPPSLTSTQSSHTMLVSRMCSDCQ